MGDVVKLPEREYAIIGIMPGWVKGTGGCGVVAEGPYSKIVKLVGQLRREADKRGLYINYAYFPSEKLRLEAYKAKYYPRS